MAEQKERVRFGAYWLLKRLAKGGMAEIYLACPTDPGHEHERLVIKKLLEQYSYEEEFLALFLQEAKLASQLAHPNIVRILGLGQEEGHLFMAMEYIDGHDLELLIRARRRWLSPVVAAYVASEVCAALSYAHQATDLNGRPMNIVHRDVTPENVMVDRQGAVKLVDFGVARASARLTTTRPGVVRGKVSHMAPEHISGHELDGRADLFALGATLYELTTGIKPFERGDHASSMWAVLHDNPPSPVEVQPGYPSGLADIVMRALEKNPEHRFRSASDMKAALDRFMAATGEMVDASTLAALVEAEPAEFRREDALPDGEEAGGEDEEPQPKTQIGSAQGPPPGRPSRPGAAPPVLVPAGPPPLVSAAELRPPPPVLMPARDRPGPPVPALGDFLEDSEDTTSTGGGGKPRRPADDEEEEGRPPTVRTKPLAELEEDRRSAAAAMARSRPPIDEPDPDADPEPEPEPEPGGEAAMPGPEDGEPDLSLQHESTRVTGLPKSGETRITSEPDGQKRVATQSLDVPAGVATRPPKRRRPTTESAWDEDTPPRGVIAQAAADAAAADAAEQTAGGQKESAAAPVFGGLLKGLLIVGLMAAAGVSTRVVTVLEYRQKLQEQADEFKQELARQLEEAAKAARPVASNVPGAPPTSPGAGSGADGGVQAPPAGAGAGDGGSALDGGLASGDASLASDAGSRDGGVAGADAGIVYKKGFGFIAVQGRGTAYIDDKSCRMPCSTKLPSGEHVVRTKGKKPFEKRVQLQAGARETVRIP